MLLVNEMSAYRGNNPDLCGAAHQQASPEAAEDALLDYAVSVAVSLKQTPMPALGTIVEVVSCPSMRRGKNAPNIKGGRCVTAFSPIRRMG
jgi:hypothetical protein